MTSKPKPEKTPPKKTPKERIDKILVQREMVESREKAQALLMAGNVTVNGEVVTKAGTSVKVDSEIKLKETLKYVSRGGLKLEGALEHFNIDVTDMVAMDIGSSTGGFTDCLLQRGATKVFCIDVGKGLLHYRLQKDPKIKLIENQNIRYLEFEQVGEKVDFVVIDVSFISLKKVIPKAMEFMKDSATLVALIKPQFEVGKGEVGKGGIVREDKKHESVQKDIKEFLIDSGFTVEGIIESSIKGTKGNKEFLVVAII